MAERATGDVTKLAAAILAGDRAALARGITLVESRAEADAKDAASLIAALLPQTGASIRIGITGSPGVGKSTLIDAFGTMLTEAGHKVAVLAVDPSSSVTGGSILGDKTRMARLSTDADAFIRPSPAGETLGGVAARTREAMLVAEAAGFDVVVVETVGTGQSEAAVADMVDVFVALIQPGSGDELQGIKKGIVERADVLAINKADGALRHAAETAKADLDGALRIISAGRPPAPVILVSGLHGTGLDELWTAIRGLHDERKSSGALATLRAEQGARWFRALVEDGLRARLFADPAIRTLRADLEAEIRAGRTTATAAAATLLARFTP